MKPICFAFLTLVTHHLNAVKFVYKSLGIRIFSFHVVWLVDFCFVCFFKLLFYCDQIMSYLSQIIQDKMGVTVLVKTIKIKLPDFEILA